MRGILYLLFITLLTVTFPVSFFGGSDKSYPVLNLKPSKGIVINTANCLQGFQVSADGKTILFVFYPPIFEQEKVQQVTVAGSFTRWKELPEWDLKKNGRTGLWLLEVPLESIQIPGNSGQPEFKFVVRNGKAAGVWLSSLSPFQLAANNLVVLPGDDTNTLLSNMVIADTQKTMDDFNLNDPESEAILANFRQVPGTPQLYRSYHPYKISKTQLKTEKPRIETVKKLMKQKAIRSIICLSGNETAFATSSESISDYQQKIIDSKHELFETVNYNMMYFASRDQEFGQLFQRIVQFITDSAHPGPYLVHCRLGTDRTGVVVAVLAGLCGTPWSQIRADYQKSNAMGTKEFRDYKLLQYSLEQIIGKKLTDDLDLKAELSAYFIQSGYLTGEQIEALTLKLKQTK